MAPEQPRGRSGQATEYRTTYDNIGAYDQTHQANYNSAGDRRTYRNRTRSVSRDHTYRKQVHGGKFYALVNFSNNSISSPWRNQCDSDLQNRRSNDPGNDDNGLVVKEAVRIEQRAVAGHSRRERHRSRTNHLYQADTADYEERGGKGSKTRLLFTAVTAIVSCFIIAKSVERGPPSQARGTSRRGSSGTWSRDRSKSRRSFHHHRD